MAIIVSLKEFLRTGRLGPITTDLTPNALAQLMGAPEAVLIGERLPFPDYWCYDVLEFCFVRDPAHSDRLMMSFFQIEYAGTLSGDCQVIRWAWRRHAGPHRRSRVVFRPFDEFSCGIEIAAAPIVIEGSIDVEGGLTPSAREARSRRAPSRAGSARR